MSLTVIGEQSLNSFNFEREGQLLTATIYSVLCENADGDDEYAYSVIVVDKDDILAMKELTNDFREACDIYDRLAILVGPQTV